MLLRNPGRQTWLWKNAGVLPVLVEGVGAPLEVTTGWVIAFDLAPLEVVLGLVVGVTLFLVED